MRQYPAPAASIGVWNNTLRPGADSFYTFPDQSDDEPQPIRLKLYPMWSWIPSLVVKKYPHPVLCGKDGPIKIFPDHQHEGEAIAPSTYPVSEWPEKFGYQPKVEVVAWGKIESPDADVGREVGLVSVYNGHAADVGRIVADSTWHHWFDINLDGFAATAAGQARLAVIEQYFMNVAAWLAPKSKQSAMRNGIVIFATWRDPLIMLDPKILPPWILGGMAKDALGQFAPQCIVRQWLIDFVTPRVLDQVRVINPDPGPEQEFRIPLPLEDIVLASAISPVLERNIEIGNPEEAVDFDFVNESFAKARSVAGNIIAEQARVAQQLTDVGDILTQSAGSFELKRSADGQFMFNLKAANGEIILTSERYKRKAGAKNGIDSVRKNAGLDERYERRESTSGQPYFVLKAANGEIIGNSEMYSSESARETGIASVKSNAAEADVDDQT